MLTRHFALSFCSLVLAYGCLGTDPPEPKPVDQSEPPETETDHVRRRPARCERTL